MAEESEDDDGGEEGGEERGTEVEAAEGIGLVRGVGFRGHEETIREVRWWGEGLGAIDLAGETFSNVRCGRVGCGGVGAGVVAAPLDDLLGGVCAAGGGDFGGAYVSDSDFAGEL